MVHTHHEEAQLWQRMVAVPRQINRFVRRTLYSKGLGIYREPLTDMEETDKEFIFRVETPGFMKADIELYPTATGISIKAEKKMDMKQKHEEKWHLGFYEDIPLPEEADKEAVQATYGEGIVELHIPKKEMILKKRRIVVH